MGNNSRNGYRCTLALPREHSESPLGPASYGQRTKGPGESGGGSRLPPYGPSLKLGRDATYHLQFSLLPLTLSPGNHKRIQKGGLGFTFHPASPKGWRQMWLLWSVPGCLGLLDPITSFVCQFTNLQNAIIDTH